MELPEMIDRLANLQDHLAPNESLALQVAIRTMVAVEIMKRRRLQLLPWSDGWSVGEGGKPLMPILTDPVDAIHAAEEQMKRPGMRWPGP